MLGDPAQSDDEERELISLPAKGGKEDRMHLVFDSGMRFRGVEKSRKPFRQWREGSLRPGISI